MQGFEDPALAPANESEWKALFETSFDDLKDEPMPPNCKTYQQRYRMRVALEKRFFGGKDGVERALVPRQMFSAFENTQFHARLVTKNYAVGTLILCTDKSDAIFEEISKETRARQTRDIVNEIGLRIEEAATDVECQHLLEALSKMQKNSKEQGDTDGAAECEKLTAKCKERLALLAPADGDVPDHTEEDADHVADAGEKLSLDGIGNDNNNTASATKPRSAAALQKLLLKMHRIVHVVSALSVPLPGLDDVPPFAQLAQNPDFAPPAHPLFVHARDQKGRGPFDQMTDAKINAKLCVLNTRVPQLNEWRVRPKFRVQIPACMADCDDELLIADNDKLTIFKMPACRPTSEVYQLRVDGKVMFKVSTCSLTSDYISVLGFRKEDTLPLCMVINRKTRLCTLFLTSIPIITAVLSTSQPTATTLLLGMKEGTILRLALPTTPSKKGRPIFTLYRPVIPRPLSAPVVSPAMESSPVVEHEAADDEDSDNDHSCQAETKETKVSAAKKAEEDTKGQESAREKLDGEALSALRRARPKFRIDVFDGSQDWVLHVGKPVPVTRLVEHGSRIVASSSAGLHLFRMYLPEDSPDRRVFMVLTNNASYDFCGNLMVVVKSDNSVQMLQIHECRVEVTMAAPAGLVPLPPEYDVECQAISMHDKFITVVHVDGSRRVIELKDAEQMTTVPASAPALDTNEKPAVDKKESFLHTGATSAKKKRSAGKKKK